MTAMTPEHALVALPGSMTYVVPLLAESNWSNRQIAAVAGVSPQTVTNTVAELSRSGQLPPRPAETLEQTCPTRPLAPPGAACTHISTPSPPGPPPGGTHAAKETAVIAEPPARLAVCAHCRRPRPLADLLTVAKRSGSYARRFVCRPSVSADCFGSVGPASDETIRLAGPEAAS